MILVLKELPNADVVDEDNAKIDREKKLAAFLSMIDCQNKLFLVRIQTSNYVC